MGYVYTLDSKCQDCYKCIRYCPVHAIEVRDHAAKVIDHKCISCGTCVSICPIEAKKIRFDIDKVKKLIEEHNEVYVSLAPSFCSEYSDISPGQLVSGLKKLGFAGVSETAIGADLLSDHLASNLKNQENGLIISRACPVAEDLIRTNYPELIPYFTKESSPLMAHCKFLKNRIPKNSPIVFIGPCIGKKGEVSEENKLLDAAITFTELEILFQEKHIDLSELEEDSFLFNPASDGRIYPLDGGMNQAIRDRLNEDVLFLSISGVDQINITLPNLLEHIKKDKKIFLEILYCSKGCINGPGRLKNQNIIEKVTQVESFRNEIKQPIVSEKMKEIDRPPVIKSERIKKESDNSLKEEDIEKALTQLGKGNGENHLNCGGCGYFTCRSFGEALAKGIAEPEMCVSYMRKLATNKANELMKRMPNAVVIADNDLTVIESNKHFAELVGGDWYQIYSNVETLSSLDLKEMVPFSNLFESVLASSSPIEKRLKFNSRIVEISVFPIEDNQVVGAILQDVTEPIGQSQLIVEKTEAVIKKNLKTVQQIAYILGENAAESEVMLNSVIESFGLKND